jgi:hypothetical protein
MADYSIAAVTRRAVYTGSAGTGPYAFTFACLETSDIAVYQNATKLTETSDYTVTLSASTGQGSVTLAVAATSSDTITLVGARALARTTDFVTAGSLTASALNTDLDSLVIFAQQLSEENSRNLKAPVTEGISGTTDMTIPAKADRLGKFLGFDASTGNPVVSSFTLSGVTASDAELNILDGATLSTAELNILDGVTSTTAELNILDGVTSNATELNLLDGITGIADEDDMSSNSATKLSTQQSIKAYVDAQIATEDTLTELNDTNITSPADGALLLYDTATSKWIDNVMSGDATLADTGVLTIANNAVETAMINADAVTNAKIADDSIDSEHYVDGSIDTAHIGALQVTGAKIAADAIDGSKIADDAIDSEHYTDGSIDTAHIGNLQVTTAKIAADAIDATKIADDAISEEHLDPTVISGLADTSIDAADHLMFFDATDSQLKKVDAAELGVGTALTEVVGDTSPQLGGNLDVNGNSIVSASAGNISITPDTTGKVIIDGLSHPTADGSAGQFLKTDGSANLSFASVTQATGNELENVVEDTTPQLGGNLDVNGNSIVSASNGDISITPNGTGDVIIDGLKHPQADGTSGQVLQTDGSGQLSFATPSANKVVQIVPDSDNLSYTISLTGANNSDGAGSKAYSITPTSSSNKVKIDFFIPQIRLLAAVAGLRMRLYRQINGGGYSHVTALSGDSSSNRRAALAGNYDNQGDGNRSSVWLGGTIVDTPNTTDQVDYKFYFGVGDSGSHTVYVNRTQNDADQTYTHRTRTHVCLSEISTS